MSANTFYSDVCDDHCRAYKSDLFQWVQCRMVFNVNFFHIFEMIFFALLLHDVEAIYFTFFNCPQHLEIFSEI